MAKEEKAAIAMAAFILLIVVVCLLERADHERVDLRYQIRDTSHDSISYGSKCGKLISLAIASRLISYGSNCGLMSSDGSSCEKKTRASNVRRGRSKCGKIKKWSHPIGDHLFPQVPDVKRGRFNLYYYG